MVSLFDRVCTFCHAFFLEHLDKVGIFHNGKHLCFVSYCLPHFLFVQLLDTVGLTVQYHQSRRKSLDEVAQLAHSPSTR
jgi:hypothetical protein